MTTSTKDGFFAVINVGYIFFSSLILNFIPRTDDERGRMYIFFYSRFFFIQKKLDLYLHLCLSCYNFTVVGSLQNERKMKKRKITYRDIRQRDEENCIFLVGFLFFFKLFFWCCFFAILMNRTRVSSDDGYWNVDGHSLIYDWWKQAQENFFPILELLRVYFRFSRIILHWSWTNYSKVFHKTEPVYK